MSGCASNVITLFHGYMSGTILSGAGKISGCASNVITLFHGYMYKEDKISEATQNTSKIRARQVVSAILVCAIVVIITMMAIQARAKVAREMPARGTNVFDSYMVALHGFIIEHKPYVDDTFPLPPFAMMLITPFTWLSRPNAQFLWYLCKPCLFVPIFWLVLSMVRRAGGTIEPWALVLIVIAWLNPLLGDIQEGQINLLMLLPLTFALWKAQEDSRAAQILSGLSLALAICIKVTPLAFLPYFLLRRRWRSAAWTVVGIFLWLLVVPGIFFGWDQNRAWLGQWAHVMVLPYVLHATLKYPHGESIPEFFTRFLTHAPAWISTSPDGHKISHYMNLLELPDGVVRLLSRTVLLGAGVIGVWWARRPLASLCCRRYVMEIAGVAAFMLWASERTWVHHYVTALLLLMAAGMIACDPQAIISSRKRARGALIAAALLIPFTSDLGRIFGHDGRRYVESLDFVLFVSLALVAAIVTARYRGDADFLPVLRRTKRPEFVAVG